MADCQNCKALAKENTRLLRIVEKQRRVMGAAQLYALSVYSRAGGVLCRRSGVPRGTWAFWKGCYQVAREVYQLLEKG